MPGSIVEDSRVTRGSSRLYVHPVTGKEYPSVTTVIGAASSKSYLIAWAAKLAAEYAVDNHEALGRTIADHGRDAAVDVVKGEAARMRHEKRDRGTLIHDVIEALLLDTALPDDMTEEEEKSVDSFLAWWDDWKPQVIFTELAVYRRDCKAAPGGYAGTADLGVIINIHGRPTRVMIDAKSGAKIDATMAAQLAAYLSCDEMVLKSGESIRKADSTRCFCPNPEPGAEGPAHTIGSHWHDCERAFVLHLRPEGYRFLPVRTDGRALAAFYRMLELWHWQDDVGERLVGLPLRPPLPDGTPAPRPVSDVMPPALSKSLTDAGYDTCERVAMADRVKLREIKGIGPKTMDKIRGYLQEVGLDWGQSSAAPTDLTEAGAA